MTKFKISCLLACLMLGSVGCGPDTSTKEITTGPAIPDAEARAKAYQEQMKSDMKDQRGK